MSDFEAPEFDEAKDLEVKVEQPKPEAKTAPAPNLIVVDEKSQMMVARDNSELYRMIQIMMKGQAFPKTIDTPEKGIACWQVAASLNIKPAVAIQNMAVVNGVVSLWGQIPKALAEATGQLEDFRLIKITDKQEVISLENKNLNAEVWGAVVQIKRRGRTVNEYTFTMEDAKRAQLTSKSGPWQQYPQIMLQRRAVAHAIKFEFPDALMGVPIAEYDFNLAPDLKDVSPIDRALALKEKMKEQI